MERELNTYDVKYSVIFLLHRSSFPSFGKKTLSCITLQRGAN